jgi:hypothetical protein
MASPDLARAFILAKSRWKSRDVVRMSDALTDIHHPVKARNVEPHWCYPSAHHASSSKSSGSGHTVTFSCTG